MTQDTWTEISADDKPAREKHTPGPWKVRPQYGIDGKICFECIENNAEVGSDNWKTIASTWAGPNPANAKLIAAAPTMLAVLHQVSRHFAILAAHGTPVDVTLEDAVHEAIDAAGGY